MPTEGQTATGPNGQRAVFTGGRWVVQGGAQMPANPEYPFAGEKAAAELDKAQNDASISGVEAKNAPQLTQAEINKVVAETRIAEANARQAEAQAAIGVDAGKAERAKALAGYQSAQSLGVIISQLEKLYAEGPGATSGPAGLIDHLPTPANKRFDKAANAARGTVGSALGFTGGQLNSVAEAQMNIGPYIPQSGDYDSSIEDAIERLRGLKGEAERRSISILGGVPDANGYVTPVKEPAVTPWSQNTIVGGGGTGAAAVGAAQQSIPINPAYQQEYAAFINQWAANPNPDAYVAKRIELDRKYGYAPNTEEYTAWAKATADNLKRGGATVPNQIGNIEAPLEGVDALRNDLVNNPVGAGVVGFSDMLGMGVPSALAGSQMQALSDEYPASMTVGQIGGAIGGTALLGGAGRLAASKLAPSLLEGGNIGQIARGVNTDALYSAIYGANSGDNPLQSAAVGAVGSLGGTLAGKTIGATIGGLKATPAAQYLASKNVPQTIGQKLGGTVKKIEDALSSVPIAGDRVGSRLTDSFEGFNRAAFNDDAFSRIGVRTEQMGEEGAANLIEQTGDYYRGATAGMNVPLDPQFAADIDAARRIADRLPENARGPFQQAIDNVVNPVLDSGAMTGEAFHGGLKNLKGLSVPPAAQGFDDVYKGGLRQVREALRGQVNRAGGADVVAKLDDADAAFRTAKTLQDAVKRARNGTRSGDVQTFTPSQLNDAGWATQSKYPGARPFAELADAGQRTLPSTIPDSGTARRLMLQTGLGAGLLGGAGTADYAIANADTPGESNYLGKTALALALLTAGGTKKGQAALDMALIRRPELMSGAGARVARKAGLFGSATLPFTITDY